MDELSEFRRGMHSEQLKHLCPLVIQLGGMNLWLIEQGKMKWATSARNAQDEILKLRIENEYLRLVARMLADTSVMGSRLRQLLAEHMTKVHDDRTHPKPDVKDFYQ